MIPQCRIMSHLLFYELPARGTGQVCGKYPEGDPLGPWATMDTRCDGDAATLQVGSQHPSPRELPVFVVAYVVASGEKPYLRSLISRILWLAHVDMEHFNRIVRSR